MTEPRPQGNRSETTTKFPVETRDGGMFDFLGKKEEGKSQEDAVMIDTTDGSDPIEKKKPKLMEELHRSHSYSSSSSDEEDGGGEKKKKKKGLKEKIKEKMSREKEEGASEPKDSSPPLKCNDTGNAEGTQAEEKKGFLDKIKEKLPGQHKKAEDGTPAALHECIADETKEKKGILEKIKDKLPGCHKNGKEE
ncbi:dehydrin COR410-like [Cornus florida]|uniref:dehydrin COR410-like n=1 Tax=Cornus florida TaxID=4283 RepID=UPI00289CFB00|nr:dehydrin COR410-like [Cornus florida]